MTLTPLDSVSLGSLFAHRVTFDQAVERILDLVRAGGGGYVVTPNVDHVCVAVEDRGFALAHRSASLSTVDGTPLMWLARACQTPLPEKISGSDLMLPVLRAAAKHELKVALFGGSPSASEAAADTIIREVPTVKIVARVCPMYRPQTSTPELVEAFAVVRQASPDIVFIAMGTPNQELFMYEHRDAFGSAVLIGIGAGLDFLAGTKTRAPKWMQRAGVEWLFRLVQEPRRLAHRYLVRDRAFFAIAARQIARSRR
jgi:N-acetylglucosaminyldiphosphoundecaprenol N-acetyl-beta-D-mannosaminyltransferase